MKKLYLILFAAVAAMSLSCSTENDVVVYEPDDVFNIDGNTVVRPEADLTSVLRNPCMGWALYDDAQDVVADNYVYWALMDPYVQYATHLYLRWRWADLEPEEGKYVWLDENSNFSILVKKAKERGLKLAFRIYYDSDGQHYQATPDYVRQAGAKGRTETGWADREMWSPYIDDPVFHEKLEKFVKAFAEEFDDPDVVDFVDGFNLGYWGEGHDFSFSPGNDNAETLAETVKWITNLYGNAFRHVQLVINYHRDIGRENLEWVLENQDYMLRHDAFGSKYYAAFEEEFEAAHRLERMIVAESCYWFVGTDKGASVTDGIDFTEQWRTDISYSPAATDWSQVHRRTYEEAKRARANCLDLREVREARCWTGKSMDVVQEFISYGGYRFAPTAVSFPHDISRNTEFTIGHIWRNYGFGMCPNHSRRWANKYKAAFAIMDADDNIVWSYVDKNADPGDWLMEKDGEYTFSAVLPDNIAPGQYRLATAVVDTGKESCPPGLELAVSDQELADGWTILHTINIH